MDRTKTIFSSIISPAFLLLFLLVSNNGQSQNSGYWQQQVNYDIQVQLQDKDNTLDGFEKLVYFNNSPDTLTYIWFHIWMNAYKNDKTAFSEQRLTNGNTDFYFSNDDQRGSTGKLNFRVNDEKVIAETHPKYIDIIKVYLKHPLAPNNSVVITTPFHVKLPYNFSRGGHIGNDYQITQWYPKPAVYDAKGWHPMPYLDQGEFYSEFGNFHVEITVPEKYMVAASGTLLNTSLLDSIKSIGKTNQANQKNYINYTASLNVPKIKHVATYHGRRKPTITPTVTITAPVATNTWVYEMNNVHDFAWFASTKFLVQYDTIQLSTKTVDVFSYYPPNQINNWSKTVTYAKDGIRHYSNWIGDYPYSTASVVCGVADVPSGGMEYPSITLITTDGNGKELDEVIAHELGHNWFYAALASNERDHAWMDEGMNTYYQKRYAASKYHTTNHTSSFINNRLPDDAEALIFETMAGMKKDQPIQMTSDSFTDINYGLVVYEKTALWMKRLEDYTGQDKFDAAMKAYYSKWQNKHPYPSDFKQCFESASSTNIDSLYNQLFITGSLLPVVEHKKTKLVPFFSLGDTHKYNYISIAPAAGYNYYDKLMPGILIHNYQLPQNKFQFYAAALYATGCNQIHEFGRLAYNIYQKQNNYQWALSYSSYNMNKQLEDVNGMHYVAINNNNFYAGVTRIVPSFKWTLFNKDARSTERLTLSLKSFLITEEVLNYKQIDPVNSIYLMEDKSSDFYYVNQLKGVWSNYRKLYPYDLTLQIDQGKDFVKTGLTGNYFFNYAQEKGGIDARFFAGKFFYLGEKTVIKQYETDRYQLNLTGANGNEDYTYSDYFIGRNSFTGWTSQQIMQRDGFFKIRTDLYASKVGKTDDWLMAINFEGKLPNSINPLQLLPFRFPLYFFVDFGTYADAWKDNSGGTERFLYDAGLYLPAMKGLAKIYVPMFYSNVFGDYIKTNLTSFWQTISFSMNLNALQPQKVIAQIPL